MIRNQKSYQQCVKKKKKKGKKKHELLAIYKEMSPDLQEKLTLAILGFGYRLSWKLRTLSLIETILFW